MAFDIIAAATALPSNVPKDDSSVDRLHHTYTVVIIVTFAVIVGGTQYVGDPITCWVPAEFGGGWTKYTNSYCWIKNTYFLPFEDEIPKDWEPEKRNEIIYYQWVPFILLAQAAFFYAPSIVWHGMNSKAGIDSDNILAAAQTFNKAESLNGRKRTLKLIVNQLDRFVRNRPQRGGYSFSLTSLCSKLCCLCGKRFGNYLIMLYIFVKLLYIGNAIGQMFVLNTILRTDFNTFGVDSLKRWNDMDSNNWINNTVFPKVTMCDFHVRRVGNVQRYTVQCALPINLYVEKMYAILWFWMVILIIITIADLISWTLRMLLGQDKLRYVKNHLLNMNRLKTRDLINQTDTFVYDYLKDDGVFLLRLIGHNTNYITVSEVIAALWDNWHDGKLEDDDDPNDNEDAPMISPTNHKPPPPALNFSKPSIPPKPGFGGVKPSAPHMAEEKYEDQMYDP